MKKEIAMINTRTLALAAGSAVLGTGLMGLVPNLFRQRQMVDADLMVDQGLGQGIRRFAGVVPTTVPFSLLCVGLGALGIIGSRFIGTAGVSVTPDKARIVGKLPKKRIKEIMSEMAPRVRTQGPVEQTGVSIH
jgi:hypothetical protein